MTLPSYHFLIKHLTPISTSPLSAHAQPVHRLTFDIRQKSQNYVKSKIVFYDQFVQDARYLLYSAVYRLAFAPLESKNDRAELRGDQPNRRVPVVSLEYRLEGPMAHRAFHLSHYHLHHGHLHEELRKFPGPAVFLPLTSRLFLRKHQQAGVQQLEDILAAAVLRQQRPLHIGGVLDADFTQLHVDGGELAVPIDATHEEPEDSPTRRAGPQRTEAAEVQIEGSVDT